MNRIEERLAALKEEGKKAFITYTTAGLPDYDTTKKIMSAQEKACLLYTSPSPRD